MFVAKPYCTSAETVALVQPAEVLVVALLVFTWILGVLLLTIFVSNINLERTIWQWCVYSPP